MGKIIPIPIVSNINEKNINNNININLNFSLVLNILNYNQWRYLLALLARVFLIFLSLFKDL